MMKKKKLQVFISSTYKDLIEERQAAVQAFLSSGHIPAGMELFTAGDESQMKVIERWIEESDAFLLILGGRYGSIEPKSGKSYTQLEYEYALKLNKPLFAIVIDDNRLEEKMKQGGSSVIERTNQQKLDEFKNLVLTRMVKFYHDVRDIKLAIYETMAELSRRNELIGWVRGDQDIDTDSLAEEMARLTKENSVLRERLEKIDVLDNSTFHGLSSDEYEKLLKANNVLSTDFNEDALEELENCKDEFGDKSINLFHVFWILKDQLAEGLHAWGIDNYSDYLKKLKNYGLVIYSSIDSEYYLSGDGLRFYLKLLVKHVGK